MKHLFSLLFVFLLTCAVSAQEERKADMITPVGSDMPAKTGTYQLVFKCRSVEEAVNLSQSELIRLESLRDETLIKYIQYSEKTVIKLFPKEFVNNPSYVPPAADKIYIVEEVDFNVYRNVKLISLN